MNKHTNNSFLISKRMFEDSIRTWCRMRVNSNTSYEEWISIPDDMKAAALFVIFYEKIKLARIKTFSYAVSDDDAVSMICEKLVKVTPNIMENPNMYSASFIYKIIRNMLGDALRLKMNQMVNIMDVQAYYGDEDSEQVPYSVRMDAVAKTDDDFCDAVDVIMTWESLTDEQKSLVKSIILKSRSSINIPRYSQNQMLAEIRRIFADFRGESKLTFGEIYAKDDYIECADVVMPDGNIAQYFGMTEGEGDKMKILFFGAYREYRYVLSRARHFEVTNVDWYE